MSGGNGQRPQPEQVDNFDDWKDAILPTLVAAHDQAEKKRKEAAGEITAEWPKVTENTVSIRFTDCDPLGHLNNGRYIDYFINGRDFQMDLYYGVHLAKHKVKTNETYVVKRHQIAYVRPAVLRERVLIRAMLLGFGDDWTFVESQMLDEQGQTLKSLLWSEFNYINVKNGRRVRQPEWIMEILRATVNPVESYLRRDFEERLTEVQRLLRNQGK
jgi:acyl-CoA thioester hydrolase